MVVYWRQLFGSYCPAQPCVVQAGRQQNQSTCSLDVFLGNGVLYLMYPSLTGASETVNLPISSFLRLALDFEGSANHQWYTSLELVLYWICLHKTRQTWSHWKCIWLSASFSPYPPFRQWVRIWIQSPPA